MKKIIPQLSILAFLTLTHNIVRFRIFVIKVIVMNPKVAISKVDKKVGKVILSKDAGKHSSGNDSYNPLATVMLADHIFEGSRAMTSIEQDAINRTFLRSVKSNTDRPNRH